MAELCQPVLSLQNSIYFIAPPWIITKNERKLNLQIFPENV